MKLGNAFLSSVLLVLATFASLNSGSKSVAVHRCIGCSESEAVPDLQEGCDGLSGACRTSMKHQHSRQHKSQARLFQSKVASTPAHEAGDDPRILSSADSPAPPPFTPPDEFCPQCSAAAPCVEVAGSGYKCVPPHTATDHVGVKGPKGSKFYYCPGTAYCCNANCTLSMTLCKASRYQDIWTDNHCTLRCNNVGDITDSICPPSKCYCGEYHTSSTAMNNIVRPTEGQEEEGLGPGAIAGIVIACIAVALAAVAMAYHFYQKRHRPAVDDEMSQDEGDYTEM